MEIYNRLVDQEHASTIDARTRYCAVYGHPIQHSASPALQNAGIRQLGLNWRYLAFDVHPDHLRAAIEGARRMKFIGLNLTVPHKVLAMDMVDLLDITARDWGAVNTIRFEGKTAGGKWQPLGHFEGEPPDEIRSQGFNTDADALVQAIEEDLSMQVAGTRILVVGVGGAGRVAALKLASEKAARVHLLNRTVSKAEAVAEEMRQRFPAVEVALGYPSDPVDLIVNATSLGLDPADPLPLDTHRISLKGTRAVYDMIYRPAQSLLLKTAQQAGCATANGLGMLLHQGTRALEIWTGKTAPDDLMRQALTEHIYGH